MGPLIELTDADPNTPGFQVDLYDGDNYVHVAVYPTAYCDPGTGYSLAITRAGGAVSSPRPNRPVVGLPSIGPTYTRGPCVGCTMDADVSNISDRDGWDESTFSYQWLADDTEIAGAISSSYTAADTELGKTLKVRVSFTDDRGTEESVTSGATKIVKLPNSDPIGKPVILGTLEVGQTLTADVSGISDANGLTNATFSYEWVNFFGPVRDGEEYTLVDGDAGKSGMWLRVTYTDDAGHEEQLASEPIGVVAARPPNNPATGAPTITGTAQVGETLTAGTTGIADADGLSGATFSYQWVANDATADTDITGATDSTYTLVAADEGNTIKVRVSFTDDAANAEKSISAETDTVSFAVQQQIANSPATGAPSISGTAQVGETLTADTSGIADADGLTSVTYSYMWTRIDGSSDTRHISTGGHPAYTLAADDEGKTIKVQVSFTDDAANAEFLTSGATATVEAAPNNSATGAPTITGTAQVGETLTADTSGIADADGLTNFTFSYQWVRNDGSSDTDITGATGSTYTLVEADKDKAIKVRVSLTSTVTEPIGSAAQQQIANSPATGAPGITGTAQVGETLTADTSGIADADGLTNVTYNFQWIGNDGSSDTDIAGATNATYTLVAADEGKTIKVRVSFTDDAANAESQTSAATATVSYAIQQQIANNPATGTPTITGTAQVGETLTADTTGIADADGVSGAIFTYQWVANDGTSDTDITGATNSTYTPVAADEGKTIKVRVSFTDDAANAESLTSGATAAVDAAPNSATTGAPSISGTAQVGETLTADTSGIADSDGLANVSYSYQWIRNDGSSDTDITSATDSTYSLVDADQGKTIKVKVTFTDDAGNEEALTSTATASVAATLLPLTVSLENNPATHNGTDVFTFEIRFSEEFPLSFRTLKFHALQVTGGTVTKALRVDNSSDIHWRITVRPDADGNVTIVLPVTDDCDDQGAICTGDGRKLSNSLEFTVAGPGG